MDLSGSPSQSPVLPKAGPSASRSRKNRLGRYEVIGRLGQGGMGVVYEAEDTLLKRRVAIKLLPRAVSANPEALKRFLREGQGAARLNHPHVVAVYDIGESEGTYFIVMELMKGGSAQDYLRTHGPFAWPEATRILRDVGRGVAAAHQFALIHRDIKPANILRSSDGVVKLADFGLVKAMGRKATVVTALGDVIGTPHFMSPEQSQSGSVDERSDIYSLGATYFALLTGRPPYPGSDSVQILFAHCGQPIPDPRDTVGDVPAASAALIRKAMAKNRSERYPDAKSLVAALDEILSSADRAPISNPAPLPWTAAKESEPSSAFTLAESYPAERTLALTGRAPRRRKWLGFAGAILLMVLLVMVGWLANRRTPAMPTNPDNWPSIAVAADKALHNRQVADLTASIEQLQLLQRRSGEPAPEADALLKRLQKALAFRESITEKGLVLAMGGQVAGLAFSPDDRWLAIGSATGTGGVVIVDSQTGEQRFSWGSRRDNLGFRVHSLAFSSDSKVLAVSAADAPHLKLWHFETGQEQSIALDAGLIRVSSVAFSPASSTLVAGFEPMGSGAGRTYLKAWDIQTGQMPFPFKMEHRAKIGAVTFTSAGEQVASASHDKRVVMWNAENGRIWRELRTGLALEAIACAPRGGGLAVAGSNENVPTLQLWDYAGSRMLHAQTSPHGRCRCLAYSSAGQLLAAGSGSQVLLWDAETLNLVATLAGHDDTVRSLAFTARGGILASGSDDQTLRLWDVSRWLTR